MSNFIHNEGFGSIFVNENKRGESSPDYTGSAKIHGKTVRIAGWRKPGRRGDFISIRITDEEARDGRGGEQPQPVQRPVNPPAGDSGFDDDEIPF